MALSLGAHVGQQNMTMDQLHTLWRKLDQSGFDWISAWGHFYEAPPAGGALPRFEALDAYIEEVLPRVRSATR